MQGKIDSELFATIIESAGALKLDVEPYGGLNIQYYFGLSGKRVGICLEDEFIPQRTAASWLILLGMADLIPRMFPTEDVQAS